MSEILPCPFCGGKAERQEISAEVDTYNAGASYIECSRCCATSGLQYDRKENLYDCWNARISDPASDEANRLRFDLRACRGRAEIDRRNLRHWREECGKLNAKVSIAKDQRNSYQKKAHDLSEALKQTLAALVAVTSLVVRAEDEKKQPSKVVASDKMFVQMLKDYDAATTSARQALAKIYDPTTQPYDEPFRHIDDGQTVDVPRDVLTEIRDLLTERKHGSPARSPSHNARLIIDDLLGASLACAEGRSE